MEIKGGRVKKAALISFLNAAKPLPYHLRAGRYQCFGNRNIRCFEFETPRLHFERKPGPMAGGLTHERIQQKWFSGFASEFAHFKQSLNGGLTYAHLRSHPVLSFHRRLR